MRVQRLKWAGLRLEAAGFCVLIDAVEDFAASVMGAAASQITADSEPVTGTNTHADFILLTHQHRDHYDPQLIRDCLRPGGLVCCPAAIADELRAEGLDRVVGFTLNQAFQQGALTITAVYAHDGVGDPQYSWVVEDGEHRILHAGDTIWHNQFRSLGARYQSFDAVFLPINGVAVQIPQLVFSPVPASLTPMQAVSAAQLLNAKQLVPMHYGLSIPGSYDEYPDALGDTRRWAAELGVPLNVLRSDQELTWR